MPLSAIASRCSNHTGVTRPEESRQTQMSVDIDRGLVGNWWALALLGTKRFWNRNP